MIKYRDKRMEACVKARKFVPYRLLPTTGRVKLGHFYWSGKRGMFYKVIEINEEDREAKVLWQNKTYGFVRVRPDVWTDYEVKNFEWKSDESPVGKNVSLTYEEIKALNCAGIIGDDIVYTSSAPKGHVYYFLGVDKIGRIFLNRDLEKSPRKERER